MKIIYKIIEKFKNESKNEAQNVKDMPVNGFVKNKAEVSESTLVNEPLIPGGGTFNWMINCEMRNYHLRGYNERAVLDIPISFDSRICVRDYKQPASVDPQYDVLLEIARATSKNNDDEYYIEDFFTSVTFYKKEMTGYEGESKEYERAYSVYFDYGTRFDKNMLNQIGTALNSLMNMARDLPVASDGEMSRKDYDSLVQIQSRQRSLLDLFLNGTSDRNAVSKIMDGIKLPPSDQKLREYKHTKDSLPYFVKSSLFADIDEMEVWKKSKNNTNDI